MMDKMKNAALRPEVYTGVRAYAAMFVVLYHAWFGAAQKKVSLPLWGHALDLTPWISYGWIGVDIFFALSGFLLTKQAIQRHERHMRAGGTTETGRHATGMPYAQFIFRRLLRVYPAYLACLSGLSILSWLGVYGQVPEVLNMALHILMTHNFVEEYFTSINGVFWTLPFEWTFYLVFPVLFKILTAFGARGLFVAAFTVAAGAKLWVVLIPSHTPEFHLPLRIETFVCGMCAAYYCANGSFRENQSKAILGAGILFLLATPAVYSTYPHGRHYYDLVGLTRHYWIMFSIAAILIGLHGRRNAAFALFDNRVCIFIGVISYSIYLLHVPILEILPMLGAIPDRAEPQAGYWRVLVGMSAATITVSAVSYTLIEKPFLGMLTASAAAKRITLLTILVWGLALVLFSLLAG